MPVSIVTNEDNMAMMSRYPDKFFDLAIVDPPYGIGAGKMTMGSGKHKFKKGLDWDANIPEDKYFSELFRVSKNQIIWGGNYFTELLTPSNDWIIWDKLNPNLSFSEAELAWCSIKKNTRIFKYYSAKVEDFGGKIHPTQKPVQLYEWILNKYATKGDLILDTHLGSGSSRIAAHKRGFDFYATELSPFYFDDQEARFKIHSAQLSPF